MNKIKKAIQRCKSHRKKILEISQKVPALHIGGSFSCVEILDCIFFLHKKKKDNFILSKGHAGIILYVILNSKKILNIKDLDNYSTSSGKLGVHPNYGIPGISASTGSLGHGLAISAGISMARNKKNFNIYVVVSDGELQEGSTWEAIMIITSLKLNNIILVIDNNGYQSSTKTSETHPSLYPIDKKLKYFGWDVKKCNGHSTQEILINLRKKKNSKPLALIANTIKGYPVSFMKNNPIWHYRSPTKKEYLIALNEINKL